MIRLLSMQSEEISLCIDASDLRVGRALPGTNPPGALGRQVLNVHVLPCPKFEATPREAHAVLVSCSCSRRKGSFQGSAEGW